MARQHHLTKRHLPVCLPLLLLLLLLPLRPPPAAAVPWSESAASEISALAVNLTRSFMANQTCAVLDWAALDQLEARMQQESVRIINNYNPSADSKLALRFQQDPTASAAQAYYYRDRYRQQGFDGSIAIIPTPPYHNHSAITRDTYTTVSIAADIRWCDVAGLGTESVPSPDRSVLFEPFFMYYRRDILAAHNMSVPTTWDGLLAAARYINGSDLDNDGRPEYAVCFNSNYHCQQAYMLLAIYASMVQTQPRDSPAYTGAWFNVTGPGMEPLVNNAAMVRALEIYARLAAYNHPLPPEACGPHSEAFSAGKCVFAFNMEQFRMNAATDDPRIRTVGLLGTALCPGSPVVLDPATNTLVPCTAATCPLSYSAPDAPPAPRINRAPLNLAIRSQFIINNKTAVDILAFRYNYFQFAIMDWSANYVGPLLTSVNIRFSPDSDPTPAAPADTNSSNPSPSPAPQSPLWHPAGHHQGTAAANVSAAAPTPAAAGAAAAVPGGRRRLRADPSAAGTPAAGGAGARVDAVGLGPNGWPYNVTVLTEKGWDQQDALGFVWALLLVWSHGNTVMDIFIPGSSYFRLALADAATNATLPGADTTAIAATLEEQYAHVVGLYGDLDVSRRIYRSCMGMTYVDNGTAGAPGAAGRSGGGSNWRPAYTAVVAALACAAVAALLLAGLVLRARARGRTLLGAVIAPGAGAATTLLVTDIQNSTMMWEQLPAPLMEEVLRVHHATLRSLLDRHRGYESATEGDSFILAFHSPADALAYAMAAQAALLEADWPPALLAAFREAAIVHSSPIKGNPDVELSYVVRRLQSGSHHAAADTTLSLASHMASLRTGRTATAALPQPPPSARACAPLRAAAARLAGALAAAAARVAATPLRWRMAQRKLDLRSMALCGSLPVTGEDGEEGGETVGSSSLSSGTASSRSTSCTFGWALSQAWVQPDGEEAPLRVVGIASPASVLTWRGLRVRMGIHTGAADPLAVQYNRASRRMQYSGSFADTAKAVADAGHGGQVLLSHAVFAALRAEDKAAAHLILALGDFEVAAAAPTALPLYQAVPRVLAPRLRCFPPLRVLRHPSPGVLEAPVGVVTVVFMKATGVTTLAAWNAEVTQEALQLYHSTVSALVPQYSGYVVEMADELALAAFQRPEAAVGWALAAQAALLVAAWPQELLEHELGEPITTTLVAAATADSSQVVRQVAVHSRGLRLKVGVAQGPAVDSVNEATARMAYRGRVMNRAARISSAASTGQVLTHREAWQAAAGSVLVAEAGITGTSTGLHVLKGIRHPIELFSCTYIAQGLGLEAIPSVEHLPLQSSLPLQHGAPLLPAPTTDVSILRLADGGAHAAPPSPSRSASPALAAADTICPTAPADTTPPRATAALDGPSGGAGAGAGGLPHKDQVAM